MDWFFHRIAASERYSAGLREIENDWTLDDVMQAHAVLDAFEAAEHEANARLKKR